ncbi:hypothetical protein BCT46_21235 [Vibrio sp. 10N.261.46.E8]|uniref:hypothetical protein n=1 Tax=unclassified Vibrio TaxID=2614977 RepID=UPI000978063D|nr:hypothetical protein [Vibrio sp. 10N.261.45.A1]OMO33713.1 hypothetical protein BH584_14535 [Vibrio sp. 10N.261.45.E1]PMJ36795.1 hypothetical protein BCU27_22785 [Vibrio sp. 10N.286.45.B6]PML82913.1 hypothetical protein BCT66_19965 [Vibrio sp. 10N.261.49.E11]PMM65703.1 hypothetical protein BCT48_18575 [Vibrio sp. 10N.261.46.F12]PMM78983.1 hypothetical protein BCT46_21235 [Vibrio sp. 10N.261.46.E8]PMN57502.1 hypothetical protein BCT32_23530 [Vibrio sp. 10N.261.45.E11]PMN76428.1 hypothetical
MKAKAIPFKGSLRHFEDSGSIKSNIYTIPMISTNELSFFGTLNPILAMILDATLMGESFS